ncbi:hydrolase [Methylophilus medardicus]|uniref:Hydrolase n=1 Tax=Methylophilus medardicus TaxID=2588534 RepID=A0A5B8CR00_9PROT|nr:hydrolase [Methylophilus medardicus]QDC43510.1 hydrolase [Methylophilus medardicus]QDC48517.1 hydrolase [Methylophilus medardicus]QDC52222.1 hydrolase [Methylophilus medardicus]
MNVLYSILIMTASTLLSASTSFANNDFKAPIWQLGGHLQTIIPSLFPQVAKQTYVRERWELPDGDFVDVDWTESPARLDKAQPKPVLVLFHGLEGTSQSHYARVLMAAAKQRGWLGVVVHFRGCSGEPNRLPRVYYAGDADEINTFISIIHQKLPDNVIYAAGVSLGGNALLKWLGQYPENARRLVKAAAAISAPIALKETAHSLDTGLNYLIYSKHFVATMKPKALQMAERFPDYLDASRIQTARSVQDMDNAVTSVLFGTKNADEYYDVNASKPWLRSIQTETLILNAKNDPFVPFDTLPSETEVSSAVQLDYQAEGGHAGFYGKTDQASPWLAARIFQFFDNTEHVQLDALVDQLIQFHPAALYQ